MVWASPRGTSSCESSFTTLKPTFLEQGCGSFMVQFQRTRIEMLKYLSPGWETQLPIPPLLTPPPNLARAGDTYPGSMHQSQNSHEVVLEGAGDQGYRALVNICKAVGRLAISVLKHCNLISLSKIHLTFFSLYLTLVVSLLSVR